MYGLGRGQAFEDLQGYHIELMLKREERTTQPCLFDDLFMGNTGGG